MNFAQPLSDATLVRAAVSVVLPWSICPMVPTFTCGLLRSNFSLAMSSTSSLTTRLNGVLALSALRLASLAQGIRLGHDGLAVSEARRAEPNGADDQD